MYRAIEKYLPQTFRSSAQFPKALSGGNQAFETLQQNILSEKKLKKVKTGKKSNERLTAMFIATADGFFVMEPTAGLAY